MLVERGVIERPTGVEAYGDLVEAVSSVAEGSALVLVLETYGVHVDELDVGPVDSLVIVVGAEDYGVPQREVERLKAVGHEVKVVRLPMSVPGASYNVVASLVMLLYELKRKGLNLKR